MPPKTTYKAAGSIRELRINVCQFPERTVLSLTWSTRERGDEPGQGHLWVLREEYAKPVRNLVHATNLAAWLVRKALSGGMAQRR